MNPLVKTEDLGIRTCRLHVDHLDNEDGRVWAVDCRPEGKVRRRYIRATNVITFGVNTGTYRRPGKRQPRAWLDVVGRVRVLTHHGGAVVVTIRVR